MRLCTFGEDHDSAVTGDNILVIVPSEKCERGIDRVFVSMIGEGDGGKACDSKGRIIERSNQIGLEGIQQPGVVAKSLI